MGPRGLQEQAVFTRGALPSTDRLALREVNSYERAFGCVKVEAPPVLECIDAMDAAEPTALVIDPCLESLDRSIANGDAFALLRNPDAVPGNAFARGLDRKTIKVEVHIVRNDGDTGEPEADIVIDGTCQVIGPRLGDGVSRTADGRARLDLVERFHGRGRRSGGREAAAGLGVQSGRGTAQHEHGTAEKETEMA